MDEVKKKIEEISENMNTIDINDETYILAKLSELSKDLSQIQYYINDLKASITSERSLLKRKDNQVT